MKAPVLHDEEAELALCDALLLGREMPDDFAGEFFFDWKRRSLVNAVLAMRAQGLPADGVEEWMESKRPEGQDANSPLAVTSSDLASIMGSFKVWHRIDELWDRLRDFHITRRVLDALGEVSRRAGSLSADDFIGLVYEMLSAIPTRRQDSGQTMAAITKATIREMHDRFEAAARGEVGVYGVPTGLRDVDELMGGLSEGVVTIVAGRPSHGKSSLTRTIADNANRAGMGVHVFTPEDRANTYAMRMLADSGRVDLGNLRTMRGVTKLDLGNIMNAANDLYTRTNWLVDDSAGLTSSQIALRIRKHMKTNHTRVVVVDYIQLVREAFTNMKESVGFSINNLAKVARDEGVAMVVLSQLSRDVEKRPDKRPVLADLRETGELEQVAESVIFVVQPAKYMDPDSSNAKERAELDRWRGRGLAIVAKHKNSATGQVELAWDAPTATYRDLSKREQW